MMEIALIILVVLAIVDVILAVKRIKIERIKIGRRLLEELKKACDELTKDIKKV